MATIAPGLLDRHHFALRRLHSLTGIVPVGLFLINHLLANSTFFLGQGHFNHHIALIHSLPWLLVIEVGFIFLPLLFHGALGVVITLQARNNPMRYPYADNWRFYFQRITAWITVAFVLVHLAHFRFAHWFALAPPYSTGHDMPGGFFLFTGDGFQAGLMGIPTWAWLVIYAIGLAAAVYHFCNGIVTFCITWGLVIGVESRRRVSLAAGALGAVLMLWGLLSLVALGTFNRQNVDTGAPPHAGVTPPPTSPSS